MSQALATKPDAGPDTSFSFDELYRQNRDDVYAYAAGLLRDRSAAEEVVSTAFERAYRKRGRFNPDRGSARAWLFGVVRNAALDELRRRRRHAPLSDELHDVTAHTGGDGVERTELRLALRDALEALPSRDRELVALKFFAGLSNAEIARVLGISESNAGTKLHRVVTKLREACDGAA
ncbi:MAG TPA: sigma-70 family RNA polymerase sigma factor [Solirubrobacterales bacterium]|nr:sigma-70 family RNA polymerase sigma factor [Solirubrobacterales bacterium]